MIDLEAARAHLRIALDTRSWIAVEAALTTLEREVERPASEQSEPYRLDLYAEDGEHYSTSIFPAESDRKAVAYALDGITGETMCASWRLFQGKREVSPVSSDYR